jgi:hypothetical protein
MSGHWQIKTFYTNKKGERGHYDPISINFPQIFCSMPQAECCDVISNHATMNQSGT